MSDRIIAAALCVVSALALSSCSVNVNEIVSSKPESKTSSVSTAADTDTHTDVFYTSDTDSASDTDTQTDTQTASEADAFDESKYLTMFVSGAAEIPLTADALYGSEEVGSLKSGDRVSVVRRDVMEYTFVYSHTLEKFGYVGTQYLADYLEETTIGEVWYVKPAKAQLYSDASLMEVLENVSMNDMLTVLVKRTDGKWRVCDKQGSVGYIDKGLLSEKKVKAESSSKSGSKSESKASSKTESKSESENESSAKSKTESRASSLAASSRTVSGSYTGKGEPPESYTEYIVDVDVGYLSLRDVPSADESELLGKLYYEDTVYVIDTTGGYWYVYSPTLGMYGYVTGDPDYLYPAD